MNLPFSISTTLIVACSLMTIIVLCNLSKVILTEIRIIFATSLLYFVGEGLQYCHLGPMWLRGHLSDTGIVAAAGVVTVVLYDFTLDLRRLAMCRRICHITLFAFVFFELAQMYTGKGDIVDIVAYHIGFLITYFSFLHLERRWVREVIRKEQPLPQAHKVATRPQKKGMRSTPPKRKR